jgi:hypothetical protein
VPADEPAPDARERCSARYVAGQELKAASRLLEAAEALRACVVDACADFVRDDCAKWLDEVERATPTVVPRFVDEDGKDAIEVRVLVDDELLAERLDGRPLALDPGEHRFRFERAGARAVERRFTIASGEKNRTLLVTMTPRPAPAPSAADEGGVHPAAWVLGGVSLVGFGVLIGFGVHSLTLEDCAPSCSQDQVDDIELERALADVGLGVGVAALGAAVLVAVLADDDAGASGAIRLFIDPAGAALRASF